MHGCFRALTGHERTKQITNATQPIGIFPSNHYSWKQPRPPGSQTLSLFNELKRRNVFRIGAAYVVAAWLLIQVTETIFPLFGFGDTPARLVVIVLAIGFIPSPILS